MLIIRQKDEKKKSKINKEIKLFSHMFATWGNNHRYIKFGLYVQGAYIREQ